MHKLHNNMYTVETLTFCKKLYKLYSVLLAKHIFLDK